MDEDSESKPQRKPHTVIPISFLRECFDLDAKSGVLTWRERPREHFQTDQEHRRWNRRCAGTTAGSPIGDGYFRVALTFGRRQWPLLAHRIVYALVEGHWPEHEIDHRDGVEAGNEIANLREATNAENGQNRKINRNNRSGFPGVTWSAPRGKWHARIAVGGRLIHLGYFDTPEQGFAAVLAAKARHHPFQRVPRGLTPRQAAMAEIWASLRRLGGSP